MLIIYLCGVRVGGFHVGNNIPWIYFSSAFVCVIEAGIVQLLAFAFGTEMENRSLHKHTSARCAPFAGARNVYSAAPSPAAQWHGWMA